MSITYRRQQMSQRAQLVRSLVLSRDSKPDSVEEEPQSSEQESDSKGGK